MVELIMTLDKVWVETHYLYKCYGFIKNARTNAYSSDFLVYLKYR